MVFTGIVQCTARAFRNFESWTLRVHKPGFFEGCSLGESIAINGVCLTLIEGFDKDNGLFFVMQETRNKTNIFRGENTVTVNVEKSLKHGDSVGGHYVLGHVHGMARVHSVNVRDDGSRDLWFDLSEIPTKIRKIKHKGCICIDGTSLTIAEITWETKEQQKTVQNSLQQVQNEQLHLFRVSLIPHTLSHTNLCEKVTGDYVNIEFDTNDDNSDTQEFPKIDRSYSYFWSDEDFMKEAIKEGERGRITAPPNPWVGSVIAKNGKIIGRGFHRKAGESHGEINAITDAEARGNASEIQGSTIYVTLEPCHHTGRTPPCDQELVKRGFSRVVVGIQDPDGRVSGKGIEFLRSAGIQVTVGICSSEISNSLKTYIHHRKFGIPYVVAKVAMSLDGKIAYDSTNSTNDTIQWITGEKARKYVHVRRSEAQAILVGSGTCLADNPILTVRGISSIEKQPLRVILDARGRVTKGNVLDQTLAPTLIFTVEDCPKESKDIWTSKGVEFQIVPKNSQDGLDIKSVLENLGKRGILQVFCEGGGKLQSFMIHKNFVDSLLFFYGNILIGSQGKPWAQTFFSDNNTQNRWKLKHVTQFDDDVCMEYDKIQ